MRTIETIIVVDDQGRATIQLPAELSPGTHRALVMIPDGPDAATTRPTMADFPRHDIPWPFPEGYTFRREDLDDDSGRGA
jgi:hypothetical protein